MKLTLVGTGITLPHVDEDALRYNLANAHLEAFVRRHPDLAGRIEVARIDLPFSLDRPTYDDRLVERVIATTPDVLGLSCYSWDIDANLALAARVREARPDVRVVIGGPSASFQARELLEGHAAVDAAVRGEGEEILAELLLSPDWRRLEGVRGVTWRDAEGAVREEGDRAPVEDLAHLSSPLLTGVLVPPRQNLMFEFSRGCRYRCKYCAWKIGGGGVRYVPKERVRAEVAWAHDAGYEHAFIIDSAVNNHDDRLEIVTDAVHDADPNGDLAFSYFVNYAFVTPKQARLLASVRAHEINVGLESVNPAALRAAGRTPIVPDDFERAIDLLAEAAGPVTLHLMLGMPGDDLDGFRRSLDFAAYLADRPGRERIRGARVHWMLVAPGSYLWTHGERFGVQVQRQGVPYVRGTSTFPREDLVRALHVIREHPRSDLFIWEDAEPLKMIGLTGDEVPEMLTTGGDHIGGRAPRRITDDDVWLAVHPLSPGRPLRRGWSVGPMDRVGGWPVIVLDGPDGRRVRVQLRPRDAEPSPLRRTASYDLVWLPGAPADEQHQREEAHLVHAVAELVSRNDA